VLLAAVDEAALFIANAESPLAAKDEAVNAMDMLIAGLTSHSDEHGPSHDPS
jgi:hypothetical protein